MRYAINIAMQNRRDHESRQLELKSMVMLPQISRNIVRSETFLPSQTITSRVGNRLMFWDITKQLGRT